MAVFTAEQIEEAAAPAIAVLDDGKISLGEVFELAPRLMEMVNRVEGMTGAEKHETVVGLLDYVLANTDTKLWLIPDAVIDRAIMAGFRLLFPVIYKAAVGDYDIGPAGG